MKITGETMIFKNDIGYSTSISNKKEDGTYENMPISVNFRKGIEVPNKTKINILDGFLSFYKTKNDEKRLKLIVLSFEQINSNETDYESEDLPF